ncbi:unnamed protein product [Durusdinium trenchii]|uniref:GH18 domain-containing protein n=1 Tax=Durusdinium trenchii TaxID=1381693 RepID=A0ABP0S7V7_9DINO
MCQEDQVLLLFLFVAKAEYFGGSQPSDPVAVVAYLPEWRYEGANWETISEHTTHLLLFSLEMTAKGKIVALDRFPRKELYEQVRQATRKHGTALMICFGGNGRSEGFSAMTRKAKNRKRFVKDTVCCGDTECSCLYIEHESKECR